MIILTCAVVIRTLVSLSIYIFVTPLAHNDDGAALSPLCYYINIYIYNDGLAGFGATTTTNPIII